MILIIIAVPTTPPQQKSQIKRKEDHRALSELLSFDLSLNAMKF